MSADNLIATTSLPPSFQEFSKDKDQKRKIDKDKKIPSQKNVFFTHL